MSALYSALGAGFVFGIGLWISGMANPKKVLGFLDITGEWDASLMLVMGGAVAVTLAGFKMILKQRVPFFDKNFFIPEKNQLISRSSPGRRSSASAGESPATAPAPPSPR